MAVFAPPSIASDIDLFNPDTKEGKAFVEDLNKSDGLELINASFVLPLVAESSPMGEYIPQNVIKAVLNDPFQVFIIMLFEEEIGEGGEKTREQLEWERAYATGSFWEKRYLDAKKAIGGAPAEDAAEATTDIRFYLGRAAFDPKDNDWNVPRANFIFTADGNNPEGATEALQEVVETMNESLGEILEIANDEFEAAVIRFWGYPVWTFEGISQDEFDFWSRIAEMALKLIYPPSVAAIESIQCLNELGTNWENLAAVFSEAEHLEVFDGDKIKPELWNEYADVLNLAIDEFWKDLKQCLKAVLGVGVLESSKFQKLLNRNQGRFAGAQTYFALAILHPEIFPQGGGNDADGLKISIIQGIKKAADFFMLHVKPLLDRGEITSEEEAAILLGGAAQAGSSPS